MVGRALVAVFVTIGLSASIALSASATGSQSVRVAASRAFATLTANAQHELRQAAPRAERAGQGARDAGARCLDTWRAVPTRRQLEVFDFYFLSVAAGYFEVDGPIYGRWVRRLDRSSTIGRVTVLRRGRRDLRKSLRLSRAAARTAGDACATVRRWQAGGFREATRPPELDTVRRIGKDFERVGFADLTAAAKLVQRHGGSRGGRAAELIADGIDEPDDRVLERCDPVLAVLDPDPARAAPACR